MFAWYLHFLAKTLCSNMADLTKYVQRHLSRIQEDFDEVDKDKSGTLDFPEVCDVLQKSGFKGTQSEAKVGETSFCHAPESPSTPFCLKFQYFNISYLLLLTAYIVLSNHILGVSEDFYIFRC